MLIRFLGTGPTEAVEGKGKNRRLNSSIYVEYKGSKFVIDVTPYFSQQIKENGIDDIDFVLLTHAHRDCMGGIPQLVEWLKKRGKKIKIYCEREAWDKVKERVKRLDNLEWVEIKPFEPFNANGIHFIPIRVIHSEKMQPGFPTVAYRFDDVIYSEDLDEIPEESEPYFENAKLWIIDAAMYFGKHIEGHLSVEEALELVKKFEPETAILIQAGHTYPDYEKAKREILEYWKKIKGDCDTEVILSYDGMEFKLAEAEEFEMVQQPFGSPGGKKNIVKKLLKCVPQHRIYVEPFAGAAALFWKKEPSEIEVLNDKDPEIAFAYKFIQTVPVEAAKKEITKFDLEPSKETFEKVKMMKPKNKFERFYKFLYLSRYSYGINREDYGWFNKNKMIAIFDRWEKMRERLKNVKIYNDDYENVVKVFDSPQTFFYFDPPYPEKWGEDWSSGDLSAFSEEDVKRLKEVCSRIKGKFLLSMPNLKWIREIFRDFNVKKILVPRTFKKNDKPEFELLISNYDLSSVKKFQMKKEEESIEGIYLPAPHAQWIWGGKKSVIVKTKNYPEMVDKALYLLDKEYCYGIIRLLPPNKITRKQFEERRRFHLISDEEVKKWWGNPKEFWEYAFHWIERFEKPRRWKWQPGTQVFVKKVEFLAELIENVKEYDPSKLTNDQLADDWRIVCAWYSTYKNTNGKGIKFSLETIVNLAKAIYREITKRVKEGKMKHDFKPEEMKPASRELYRIVSGEKPIIHSKIDLTNLDFLKAFEDFTIIKDFISLVGSTVKRPPGHVPNDVDLQIRLSDRCPICGKRFKGYIQRAVEVRLLKMLEQKGMSELIDKIHFIWGDPEGSHDDFIPLYDLKLERIKPVKIVKMQEVELADITLMKPFLPQKPYGSAYYKIDKFLDALKDDAEYSVQYKANGFHASIHKKGSEVKIFSEQKKDITSAFPTLVEAIKKLSDADFIIDGELLIYKNGKPAGRRDLMKFIGAVKSGKKIDDSNVRLMVWDIPYYEKNISELPLREREKYLGKLRFSNRVMRIQSKVAKGKEELKKAIEWAASLPGSEGAVVKDLSAPYYTGEHKSWLKFRTLVDIDCVVIERVPKKRGLFNYLVGIYLRDKDKNIHPDKIRLVGNKKVLVLGHTFNTDEKIEPGEIVSVLVEEVWRHETPEGIYYSIHKPRLAHVTEKKNTSTVDDLEDIVTSVGAAVIEKSEFDLAKSEKDEGKEVMVRDFPKRMQNNFRKIMENKLWMPWVMQIHTIGRKLHRDFRFFIPGKDYGQVLTWPQAKELYEKRKLEGVLEGFTLFKPATIEEKDFDLQQHVQGTIKVPQPVDWLFFQGVTHRIGTAGTRYPGVFVIAAHGIYTVHAVDDHKIRLELKSDKGKVDLSPICEARRENAPVMLYPPTELQQFNGQYSIHIAHIEKNKWIILFDKLKTKGKPSEVSGSQMSEIYELRKKDYSIKEICDVTNLCKQTVYRYLKKIGMI